jgi:hypothetical protein
VKPDNIFIQALENLLEFATEECKVNFLDKEKSLNFFKIVLAGIDFEDEGRPQALYAPPQQPQHLIQM